MSEAVDWWRGDFGDEYSKRNRGEKLIANNVALFRKALLPMFFITPMRVIEFGANIGLNIHALREINVFSTCEFTAVEPNAKAAEELRGIPGVHVHETSMQDADEPWGGGYDLSISKGVLIHVKPEELYRAYGALYRASRRYIFLAEYHNPTPVEVTYRGETGRLWKRDFAAEMLEMFSDLHVRNYGFAWKHDPHAPQDDIVWTLLERAAK
jgi:pseudaminic acid biosynthesis-associated methylase